MHAEETTKLVQENKNVILLALIIIVSLGLFYYVLFGNKDILKLFGPGPSPTPTPKSYQSLDKNLNTIIEDDNPEETAKENNLAVEKMKIVTPKKPGEKNTVVTTEETGVKALITLKDESFVFTEEYGKEVLRYGKFIQAIVKFDKLEELAKNPMIESIQAPLKNGGPQ